MKSTMLASFMSKTGETKQLQPHLLAKEKRTSLRLRILALLLCVALVSLLNACILQSTQTNTAPSVRIISPQDADIFVTSSLRISIEAQDAEKNIRTIKVYQNGQAVGEARRSLNQGQDTALPERWYFNWTAPESGTFLFSAEAIDKLGQKSSASVSFEVQIPSPTPPTSTDTIAVESYKINLALWQQQNIDSYMINFRKICFCLPDLTQEVKLSVDNNTLSSAVYLNGVSVNQSNYLHFYPIDKAFSLIQEAFATNAAEVRVVYDSDYGFPTSVFIDYDERLADEELQFKFSNLIPD